MPKHGKVAPFIGIEKHLFDPDLWLFGGGHSGTSGHLTDDVPVGPEVKGH